MEKKASYLLLVGALLLLTALPGARATALSPVEATPTNTQTITATPIPSPGPTVAPATPDVYDPDTGETVTFVGRITPQIVSAIVPCNIAFTMNPGKEYVLKTGNGDVKLALSEVTNPDAAVVNNSIWPIRLSVTDVKTEVPAGETGIELIRTMDPKENEVLLVLGEKEPNTQTGPHIFENQAEFLKQALLATSSNGSPPPPPLPILDVGAKETKNLWVYGKAAAADEYSFTVTLTLRIDWIRTAKPPDPTP